VLVCAWYKKLQEEAFDHGLWLPSYEFFEDKTPGQCVTFGTKPTNLLPPHLSALLGHWSAGLANVLCKPATLPNVHEAKCMVLAMDDEYGILIPVLRPTHPHYSASRALSMNALTQEVGVNVIDIWEAFKDHKRTQAVCEGSSFNLVGKSSSTTAKMASAFFTAVIKSAIMWSTPTSVFQIN
jgi:hypothetical protein